jgi:hypothetical protein
MGKAKANEKNSLTSWRVKFGVKKYSALGVEQEFLGAEMVTGLIKIGTDTLTKFSFPAMLQPLSPRYLTVYGKAYKVPVLCKDYERTANVINTWLSINSDPQVAIGGTKQQVIAWNMATSELYDNFTGDRPSVCQGQTIFGMTSSTGQTDIYDINFVESIDDYLTKNTAISLLTVPSTDDTLYTLSGIKIQKPEKGIYLTQGKKIIK